MDWALQIIAWVLGGVAVVALGWALFSDRARGRRRCPRCWYDMSGAAGLRCPECGRTVRSERGLARTRRRWRWVVAALALGVVAYGTGSVSAVRKKGWRSQIPSAVLVTVWPVSARDWISRGLDGQGL